MSVDLFPRRSRKLVPLTLGQAYSLLFCQKGSDLYKELRQAWKLYKTGDEATIGNYGHLFAAPHNPKLPFVMFQQVILKDMVSTAPEEELAAVREYIETRFQQDTELREHPWQALKVDDLQSDIELERQYIKE